MPLRRERSGTSRSEGGYDGYTDTAYCGQGDRAESFLDEHVRLIVLGFGREEVTKESVEEYVDVADIVPLTRALFRWIQSLTFSKLVNLPNGEAEKEV